MEAEFRRLEEHIKALIQRVRELERERGLLQAKIDDFERLREKAAARVAGILDRLKEPE